jgi:hypothetical protein
MSRPVLILLVAAGIAWSLAQLPAEMLAQIAGAL